MLKPRPIYELLDYTFVIPAYQRGYRWDVEQVEALLNDLKQFSKLIKAKSKDTASVPHYYCLQPIAVVADASAPGRYIVVDGQQRLTTLYLLMQYLRPNSDYSNVPVFSLIMDARDKQQDFLDRHAYSDDSDTTYTDNIDNFYIRTAFDTINRWFDLEKQKNQKLPQNFRELLMAAPDEDEDPDDIHNVRVIWYEIEGVKAREAFRRLNYGKIPLTSTELVKALLLQSHRGDHPDAFRKSASYRRAVEWDTMERTLHDRYLWSMLSDDSDNSLSHINLILDFVADDLNDLIVKTDGPEAGFVRKAQELLDADKDARDYFNYNVIEYVIAHNTEKADDPLESIWSRIRDIYNLITNWFDDRTWYHLIGLLRIMPKKRRNNREFVRSLYRMSVDANGNAISRPDFTKALKLKIRSAIPAIPDGKTLETLNYEEDGDLMRAILKALNVKTAIDDPTDDNRFAFHLFDRYNLISLDHIHPQNVNLDTISFAEYKEWFARRCEEIGKLSDNDFAMAACAGLPEAERQAMSDEQRMDAGRELREKVQEAEEVIASIATSPKAFGNDENRRRLAEATGTFDSLFGQMTGISQDDLHSIANMALVDTPTNAALQNFMLDRKRSILMERHAAGQLGRNDGTYAMPSTRMVYSKDYSREAPGDMRFWRKADRDNYLDAIRSAYRYFMTTE